MKTVPPGHRSVAGQGGKVLPAIQALWARPVALGLLVATVFIGGVLLLLPVRYETNDDMGIIQGLMAAPTFRDAVGSYLSQPARILLAWLYHSAPGVPWYGIVLYLGLWLGMGLFFSVLARRAAHDRTSLLLWPVCLFLFLLLTTMLNFSGPTAVLMVGAFLCLLDRLLDDAASDPGPGMGKSMATLLLGALVFGLLLRTSLAVYLLALGAPLLLFTGRRQAVRALPWAAVAVAVLAVHWVLGSTLVRDRVDLPIGPGYSGLRATFHDTIKGDDHGQMTDQALARSGWTREDYRFFRNWAIYDEEMFNPQKLRTFLEANDPKQAVDLGAYVDRFVDSYRLNRSVIHLFLWAVALALALAWPAFRAAPRSRRLRMAVTLLFGVGAIVFLMFFRFKPRVYVPILLYVLGLAACCGAPRQVRPGPGQGRPGTAAAAVFLVLAGVGLWLVIGAGQGLFKTLGNSRIQIDHIRQSLSRATGAGHGAGFLMLLDPTMGLGTEFVHPLKEWREFPAVRVAPCASAINTRRYYAFLQGLGMTGGRELLRSTLDNPGVLYALMSRGPGHARSVTGMWESYFNRRLVDTGRVAMVPVMDHRNARGVGMVYYAARSGRHAEPGVTPPGAQASPGPGGAGPAASPVRLPDAVRRP